MFLEAQKDFVFVKNTLFQKHQKKEFVHLENISQNVKLIVNIKNSVKNNVEIHYVMEKEFLNVNMFVIEVEHVETNVQNIDKLDVISEEFHQDMLQDVILH